MAVIKFEELKKDHDIAGKNFVVAHAGNSDGF